VPPVVGPERVELEVADLVVVDARQVAVDVGAGCDADEQRRPGVLARGAHPHLAEVTAVRRRSPDLDPFTPISRTVTA
jgi:hypothetical protein